VLLCSFQHTQTDSSRVSESNTAQSCRVYTLLDALALAQALVLNWHVLRRLGNWEQVCSCQASMRKGFCC
jgi:hypothetical protein